MGNVYRKIWGKIGVILLGSMMVGCASPSTSTPPNTAANVSPAQPNLGLASSFAVIGGTAGITNQGIGTTILGDIATTGSSTMITGFHSSAFSYTETPLNMGAVTGTVYTAGPPTNAASLGIATQALADAQASYTALAALPGGVEPGAGQLGAKTLTAGVYKSNSGAFLLTGGDLTLDGQSNPNSVWVFQMASSLTVGSPTASQSVLLINGAQAKNVFWQVGSAATINSAGGGVMVGTIISNAGATFSTPGNTTLTTLNGRVLSLIASVTMVNTQVNPNDVVVEASALRDKFPTHITLSGSKSGNVTPTIVDGGFINVQNDGAAVIATVTGTGTINVVNSGAAVTGTLTGTGSLNLVNSGAGLTATNTGNGKMTIHNTATAAVTVTNTGSGNTTVIASGSTPITLTFTDNLDHVYPDTQASADSIKSRITVSGINALDVAPVLTGTGYISVLNDGAHVAATETGSGSITVINQGVGGVIAATNTGDGAMTIHSTATAAVSVTNTGNGRVTVYASGSTPIAIVHNGDADYTYGDPATILSFKSHIKVFGSASFDVSPVLTGAGFISVVNNGAHVAATQTGTGTVNVVNNGLVLSATNTGSGKMTINSTATGAVTVTNTGNGDITVNASGPDAITLTYSDGLSHTYPDSSTLSASHLTLSGSNTGGITPTITGTGYIVVANNGGFVTPTVTGTGTINILNNTGAAGVTATLTGSGPMNIVNSGAGVTATNTGNGTVTINNRATAAVTVTNLGNGRVTVYTTGSAAITLTHEGDEDYTYGTPFDITALSFVQPHVVVTGSNALDVAPVLSSATDQGYINVVNNGAHVAATENGNGTISIINNGVGCVVAATNNVSVLNGKSGTITINSTSTAAVTVTNNGSGHVTVIATGTTPCTFTAPDDGLDHVYLWP